MRRRYEQIPGYNLQIAVDAEHALIVAHEASTEGKRQPELTTVDNAEDYYKRINAPDQ